MHLESVIFEITDFFLVQILKFKHFIYLCGPKKNKLLKYLTICYELLYKPKEDYTRKPCYC